MNCSKGLRLKSLLTRAYHIKKVLIAELDNELAQIKNKIPFGTYRLAEFPGIRIIIARPPSVGSLTSWKDVAKDLAKQYGVTDAELKRLARSHRTYKSGGVSNRMTFAKETSTNPKGPVL